MNFSVLNSPAYDLTTGWIFYLLFFGFGVITYMGITILETFMLRLIKWGPIRNCFRDSAIANLITTIIGYFVAQDLHYGIRIFLMRLWKFKIYPLLTDVSYHGSIFFDGDFHDIVTYIVMWVITVVIEGLILLNIRGKEEPKTWAASLIINTASYVALYYLLGFRYWPDMIV